MNKEGSSMSPIKRFNLIDEPWIPIVGSPPASLRDLFTKPRLALAGNPIEKIALIKLFLAIAQAASTPKDSDEWHAVGADGLARKCLEYLDRWHDSFWLYGPTPFLQMPSLEGTEKKRFGLVMPQIGPDNNTILFETQLERPLTDADKAVLVVTLMGFAFASGKKNKGKTPLVKAGTLIGDRGYLHSFLMGGELLQIIWLNLLTLEQIQGIRHKFDVGRSPWEEMPHRKDCPGAERLKDSLMGRLVPLSRFCLLSDEGLHYQEGIDHPTPETGGIDPTIATNWNGKKPKTKYVDPSERPWRFLTSLLGFMSADRSDGWNCIQLKECLRRAIKPSSIIGIWSGGLRVTKSGFGDQKVSGTDDFVESYVELESDWIGESSYLQLRGQMEELESLSKKLGEAVRKYFKEQKAKGARPAQEAIHLYWQLCEKEFSALLKACDGTVESLALVGIGRKFIAIAEGVYDRACPHETSRQLDAWAKHRSGIFKSSKQKAKK